MIDGDEPQLQSLTTGEQTNSSVPIGGLHVLAAYM